MTAEKKSLYAESSATPSQIEELYAQVRALRRHHKGYRALHLHFSLLDRLHKQPIHRRRIATAFNGLIQKQDGRLFWLGNFDLFFLCRDASVTAVDQALLDARRAVKESPLLQQYLESGRDAELCDWYDLEKSFPEFLALVEGLRATEAAARTASVTAPESAAEPATGSNAAAGPVASLKALVAKLDPKVKPAPAPVTPKSSAPEKPAAPPMGPLELDKLERHLQHMDISRMIAHQDACVRVGSSPPQPVFREFYLSIEAIGTSLLPGFVLQADKWLFQRLTRTLDLKLMQALGREARDPGLIKSLNINVDSVLSAPFDSFLQAYRRHTTQPLILEMKLPDILSDLAAYDEARKKLAACGCKLSIDAMDLRSIGILDRELLNVDFLKICWRDDYPALLRDDRRRKVIGALKAQGKMRLIFCHCDSAEAVRFGQEIGIHMFQGYYIDGLLRN